MKRWIRCILLTCSIALTVAAALFWARGNFGTEAISANGVRISNGRHRLLLTWWTDARFSNVHFYSHMASSHDITQFLPQVTVFGTQRKVSMPHWIAMAMGAAFPAYVWLRHRSRKAAAGFPVEEVGPRVAGDPCRSDG